MFVERKGLYLTVTHLTKEADEVAETLSDLEKLHPWSYHQGEHSPSGACYFHRIAYSTDPDAKAAEKWLAMNNNR